MKNQLFERIADLSPAQRQKLVERLQGQEAGIDDDGLLRRNNGINGVVLSPQQRRLWTLAQISAGSTEYNIPGVFTLTGTLNEPALRQALATIAKRHEILRTVVTEDAAGELKQQICADATLPYQTTLLSEPVDEERLNELVVASINEPFDLVQGPLWKAELITATEQRHVLVLSMHHIIFDGWSLGVFVRELFDSRQMRQWLYVLCGPPAMMDAVEETLIEIGVPTRQVRSERFRYD